MRALATFAYAFAAGTALYQYLLSPPAILWGGGCAVLLALAGFLLGGRRRLRLLLMACALSAGVAWSGLFELRRLAPARALDGVTMTVQAEVTDYAQSAASGRLRLPVHWEGMDALLYGGEALAELSPGDQITAEANIRCAGTVRGETIYTFTSKGIYLLLYPKGALAVTPGRGGHLPQRLRRWMETQLAAHNDTETAAFLSALLLGDRSGFTTARATQLSEAGLAHITAVSGLHCGFVVTAATLLLGRHRRRRALAAIPLLLGYMLLVGCSASVVRAVFAQILCLFAPILRRPDDALTSLGAAMLALLAVNPGAIANIGFQLSFSAMFGVLCVTPWLYKCLTEKRKGRVWNKLAAVIAASLGAGLATAPFCAGYFGRVVLVSPISNLLTFPVVEAVFVWGMVSIPVLAVCPGLTPLFALPLRLGTAWVLGAADVLARLPYHAVYLANRYLPYWLVYTGCLLFYCAFTPKARRKYLLAAALSAGMLVFLLRAPAKSVGDARLHAMAVDVGQGASAVLSSQGQTAVVDCGSGNSFLSAGTAAADALAVYGYDKIDYLILTHCHADHANGLETLLARTNVGTIVLPALEEGLYDQVLSLAEAYRTEVSYILEPEQLPLGLASLTLYPPLGAGGTNEEGLTVLCTMADFDLLITGDMDGATERRLTETYDLPDIEVLLAGHHGSRYSSSYDLLRDVTPEVGVISVGTNSYGHPAAEAMERMAGAGMTLYRTDLQGTVSILVK